MSFQFNNNQNYFNTNNNFFNNPQSSVNNFTNKSKFNTSLSDFVFYDKENVNTSNKQLSNSKKMQCEGETPQKEKSIFFNNNNNFQNDLNNNNTAFGIEISGEYNQNQLNQEIKKMIFNSKDNQSHNINMNSKNNMNYNYNPIFSNQNQNNMNSNTFNTFSSDSNTGCRYIHNRTETHTEVSQYILQNQNSNNFNNINENSTNSTFNNNSNIQNNQNNNQNNQNNNQNNNNNTQNDELSNQNYIIALQRGLLSSDYNSNLSQTTLLSQNSQSSSDNNNQNFNINSNSNFNNSNIENSQQFFDIHNSYKIGNYKRKPKEDCTGSVPLKLAKALSFNGQNKNKKKQKRFINSTPEKILDAPDIKDDYYLNLMDWGKNGILAVCLNSAVYLWNSYTQEIQELLNLSEGNGYISSVQWMPEKQNVLAVGLSNSTIQLWDTEHNTPYRNLTGHTDRVSSLSWNRHVLSSGSRDTNIINHDVRVKENIINKWENHTQEVCGLKWSYDGNHLASGSNDNSLYIWNAQTSQIKFHFNQHIAAVKALAWCPWQSDLLVSGGGTTDKTMKFWDVSQGRLLRSVDTDSQVCSVVWNPHDRELVSSHGYSQNQLIVWDYNDMEKIQELHGHTNRVLHMGLNPEGTTICSAAMDETLRFWNVFENTSKQNKKQQNDLYSDYLSLNSNQQFLR